MEIMFYRLTQFFNALFPRIDPDDIEWAKSMLPPQGFSLFLAQSRIEQKHALDVAKSLRKYAGELSSADYHALIQASLLHDCGKQQARLSIWHRVAVFILNKLPELLRRPVQKFNLCASAMEISQKHPAWGRDLARKSGLSEKVCLMIERHHSPPRNRLDQLLYQADNQN